MVARDWKDDFQHHLEDFVDRFVVIGADRVEVLDLISAAVPILRSDFEHDPDPSEEGALRDPEPSNDWPAADR